MKSTARDMLRAVIVLGSIALIAGLLLGFLYPLTRLTQAELDKQAMKPLQNLYPSKEGYEVVRHESGVPGLDDKIPYFFKAKGEEAYIVLAVGKGGYGGDVQVYVVIKDNMIIKVEKGANKETIAIDESFYRQFYGVDATKAGNFVLGSGEGEIDKVTGATMSSRAITDGVNSAISYFKTYAGSSGEEGEIRYERLEDGTLRFYLEQAGYYVDNGRNVEKELKIVVDVAGDVIERVADNGSTFSPPPWSVGLAEENLNQYVGKNIWNRGDFVLGTDIDVAVGATGTSNTLAEAMNRLVRYYNRMEYLFADAIGTGTRYTVQQRGYYVNEGERVEKMLRIVVEVDAAGVITRVADGGSTFSPPAWSPGLSEENLNRYVGKSIAGRGDFVLGTDIDVAVGATGTSNALAEAMNRIVRHYNEGGGGER